MHARLPAINKHTERQDVAPAFCSTTSSFFCLTRGITVSKIPPPSSPPPPRPALLQTCSAMHTRPLGLSKPAECQDMMMAAAFCWDYFQDFLVAQLFQLRHLFPPWNMAQRCHWNLTARESLEGDPIITLKRKIKYWNPCLWDSFKAFTFSIGIDSF